MFESYSQDTKINSVSLLKHKSDQVTKSLNSQTSTNTSTTSSNFGSNLNSTKPLENKDNSAISNSNSDKMSIEFANNSTLSQKDEFDSVPSKNSSLPPMENYKENGHDQEQEKRQIDVITPTDSQNQQQQQQQQQQESSSSSSSQSQSQSHVNQTILAMNNPQFRLHQIQ
ncbi:unnamed protein product [[Candida] boidinii]|nr:unnamed protein product [[Candida] boidinii]